MAERCTRFSFRWNVLFKHPIQSTFDYNHTTPICLTPFRFSLLLLNKKLCSNVNMHCRISIFQLTERNLQMPSYLVKTIFSAWFLSIEWCNRTMENHRVRTHQTYCMCCVYLKLASINCCYIAILIEMERLFPKNRRGKHFNLNDRNNSIQSHVCVWAYLWGLSLRY